VISRDSLRVSFFLKFAHPIISVVGGSYTTNASVSSASSHASYTDFNAQYSEQGISEGYSTIP
jgi:hypothetical protein